MAFNHHPISANTYFLLIYSLTIYAYRFKGEGLSLEAQILKANYLGVLEILKKYYEFQYKTLL